MLWIGAESRMEILLYISVFIIAVSLLQIAIFVIIALRNAKKMISDASKTLERIETKVIGITTKSDLLMERTNRIAADVESKMKSLEDVAQSARHLKQSSENLKSSFYSISQQIGTPEPRYNELIKKLTTLTECASNIFYKFKYEKQKQDLSVQQKLRQLPPPTRVKEI